MKVPSSPLTRFNLDGLRAKLRPFRLHWFPRVRSTNDHAAVLRRRGELFAPAVVLTGHQIAGRGRGSNQWWSGPGALTVTFVLPIDQQLQPHQLPLIAGLAVRNAIVELSAAPQIQLKWPNDVVCDGRKLAGLLCERAERADLIGLGLNVNVNPADAPANLRRSIASLSSITGTSFDPNEVLAIIAKRLYETLARRDETSFQSTMKEYTRHHVLPGQAIRVSYGNGGCVSGRCEGIDFAGRLLVRDRHRLHRLIAGQVLPAESHKPTA